MFFFSFEYGCNRAESSRVLGFQDWLVYKDTYSSQAQVRTEL